MESGTIGNEQEALMTTMKQDPSDSFNIRMESSLMANEMRSSLLLGHSAMIHPHGDLTGRSNMRLSYPFVNAPVTTPSSRKGVGNFYSTTPSSSIAEFGMYVLHPLSSDVNVSIMPTETRNKRSHSFHQGFVSTEMSYKTANNTNVTPDAYLQQSETQPATEFEDDESIHKIAISKYPAIGLTPSMSDGSNYNNNNRRLTKPPTCKTWISPFPSREENLRFFLFYYKVRSCPDRRNCPEKVTCDKYHHEGERRRKPGSGPTFLYCEEACPEVKPLGSTKWLPQNRCINGDRCHFSHTLLEQMYHPNIYKTSMCVNFTSPCGNRCKWGYYCTHAHGHEDIRPPITRRLSHPLASKFDVTLPQMETFNITGENQNMAVVTQNTSTPGKNEMEDQEGEQTLTSLEIKNPTEKIVTDDGSKDTEKEKQWTDPISPSPLMEDFAAMNLTTVQKQKKELQTGNYEPWKDAYHTNWAHHYNNWTKMGETEAMLLWYGVGNEPDFLKQLSPPAAQGDLLAMDTDSDDEFNAFPINISTPYQTKEKIGEFDNTDVIEWTHYPFVIPSTSSINDDGTVSANINKHVEDFSESIPQLPMQLFMPLCTNTNQT